MKSAERSFQVFIDVIQTLDDEIGFETIAKRMTQCLPITSFQCIFLHFPKEETA